MEKQQAMPETHIIDSSNISPIDLAAPVALGSWNEPVLPFDPEQHTLAEARVTEGILPPVPGAEHGAPTGPRIHVALDGTAPQVVLRRSDTDTVLPALWLRARSPDPSQRDAITG